MNTDIYQEIAQNPRFKELVKKRSHFSWTLSIITLVMYVTFILLIAFYPQWLGTPLYQGAYMTRGIPIGIGLIVISFLLTGIYVLRANTEFDKLTTEIIDEVEK